MVRRTARACTNGITPITSKPAIKNPIPVYMICSTMTPPELDQPLILTRMPRWTTRYPSSALRRPCERYRSNYPSGSERVPGRRRREFEIADIGAETNSDPGADRNHDDIVHRQRRHSQAADEVGRAVDAGKTL